MPMPPQKKGLGTEAGADVRIRLGAGVMEARAKAVGDFARQQSLRLFLAPEVADSLRREVASFMDIVVPAMRT